MTFTVASNSFKDGDYLPSDFFSSDFGFGCAGRNRSPQVGRARGYKKLGRSNMMHAYKMLLTAAVSLISASSSWADTLPTRRIPAALAVEAANETVAACARQGYRETAVVLDADGAIIVALRGDGAGIHTLDSAHDKAYTAVSFKNDTLALAERAKGEDSIAPLAKLPHVMFFGGGVVFKVGDEVIGSIGAAGAPGAKFDDGCARAGLDKIRDQLR